MITPTYVSEHGIVKQLDPKEEKIEIKDENKG